ncbi:Scr1 family TA system antitoxin-like transcriptional regulator [Streptomyces pinistramenti]|uniref:Scr1 family TA system antitoxin-like transcriptional regulator n=1 Tax=Streptomyces pinistramenti TaxID=2884812 RepID=UPI001D0718B6|nr:Scr1 family TA system antitoxin-like transcriptional regulator [Streptomyces pinistramenti]MCB5911971.1 DUF5753 domain-containing protein [Streptomyces pinistramenti]
MPHPAPPLDGAPPPGRLVATVALRNARRRRGQLLKDVPKLLAGTPPHAASPPTRPAALLDPDGSAARAHREPAISISTVSRMERGTYPLEPAVIRQLLLNRYGVGAEEARAVLHLLGHEDAEWSVDTVHDAGPGWYERLAACERVATAIRWYDVTCVPRILQTPAYNAALLWMDPEIADHNRALPPEHAERVTALLDYMILERPIGGPVVMAEQLRHLLDLEVQGARLRIVPNGGPPVWEWGQISEMAVYGQLLYAMEAIRVTYCTGPDAGGLRAAVLDTVEAAALSEDESLHQIRTAAQKFEDQTAGTAAEAGR